MKALLTIVAVIGSAALASAQTATENWIKLVQPEPKACRVTSTYSGIEFKEERDCAAMRKVSSTTENGMTIEGRMADGTKTQWINGRQDWLHGTKQVPALDNMLSGVLQRSPAGVAECIRAFGSIQTEGSEDVVSFPGTRISPWKIAFDAKGRPSVITQGSDRFTYEYKNDELLPIRTTTVLESIPNHTPVVFEITKYEWLD